MSVPFRAGRAALLALLATLMTCFVFSGPAAAHGGADDGHGGHGNHGTKPLPADADRCDLGFNTKGFNDIIRNGQADDPRYSGARFKSLFMAPLPWWDALRLNQRGWLKATYGWIASQQMLDGRKKVGHTNHSLVDPWNGMTDPVVCAQLKDFLLETKAYAAKYPKLRDAFADGMEFITPWFAGAGAHVGRWSDYDDKLEPGRPEVLIYDGNSLDSNVVGAMYSVNTMEGPNKITPGGNDIWHQHRGLCWTSDTERLSRIGLQPGSNVVIGGEAASDAWCKGTWNGRVEEMSSLWMMHVWVVPGCTSDYGVFSHDLPYLTFRNFMGPNRPGCGTGLAPNAPLTGFENDELNRPGRLSTYRSSQLSWTGAGEASGPVAAMLEDHPGEAHADGEQHLAGKLVTEDGFTGATGQWPVSLLRELDGTIHGTITSPNGTVATFTEATAERTELGVKLTAEATVPGGQRVQLALELADRGLRGWFLDAPAAAGERLVIHHPAHGHTHAEGPVSFSLSGHPGENHVGEEHLFGTATTRDGFTGDTGTWTVSLLKNTTTKAISGYLKSPDASKTFNFTVTTHHDAEECSGGVHVEATGSETATPADPQNPELVICDPAVTAFFADHDHSGHDGHVGLQPAAPGHNH